VTAAQGKTGVGPRIAILALQGDYAAHAAALRDLGIEAVEIRRPELLDDYDGLVLPGGESTTLLRLLGEEGKGALRRFAGRGVAILGTCAGLILLARRVTSPPQSSLGLLDVDVARNAYGRQVDSFTDSGEWIVKGKTDGRPLEMVFIRAPRILRCGRDVEVLARRNGEPVLVRQGRILAAAFHPELAKDRRVHEEFVQLARLAREGTAELPRVG
jgi:5'-phosphate synthase pdxT subunit